MKLCILSKNTGIIYLAKSLERLEPVIVSSKDFLTVKNAKAVNISWQLQAGTHFFTTLHSTCKDFIITKFSLFQRNFNSGIKFTLAFYEDSSGYPGKRISAYFLSPDTMDIKGRIGFKFSPPLEFQDERNLFFEIAGLDWPANDKAQSIKKDYSIQFSFKDPKNYTLAYFKTTGKVPLILANKMTKYYLGKESLEKYEGRENPIFQYEFKCKKY